MEDHFLLFPILILVGILYVAWYIIKLIWITLGLIFILIRKIYRKIMNKNVEGVNNNNVIRWVSWISKIYRR